MNWFNTIIEDGKTKVFDPVRKIYCTLTPEEKVRQMTLYYLVEKKNIPAGLIAVEYSIKVNNLPKRCDIVIFNRQAKPIMIVECKAETVSITEKVLDQAIRYYSGLNVNYLLLTNGKTMYCYHIDIENNKIEALREIPELLG
ncbi:MAG: type I restriction enzyme HsdR N-terminal domain-containing protein [Bacteroidales bacterium]|nr:type I restriction enzyme HsdR N-terminal domain-containing protein [Bacteroidales bacterium]MBR5781743.1 type I restriction enzyme HsdR N-terminal domain-containing protein [Bacteroidales bacterium]